MFDRILAEHGPDKVRYFSQIWWGGADWKRGWRL